MEGLPLVNAEMASAEVSSVNATPDDPLLRSPSGRDFMDFTEERTVPSKPRSLDLDTELNNVSDIASSKVAIEKLCDLYKKEIIDNPITVYGDIADAFEETPDDNKAVLRKIGLFIDNKISQIGISLYATELFRTYWDSLFIWAVLFVKKDAAYLALHKTQDPIATALIGSHLSKGLGDLAESEREFGLAKDAYKNAIEFEKLAVSLIDECYEKNNIDAVKLVIRKLKSWQCGNESASLLTLAHDMRCEEFLGTTSCQARIEQVWRGYFISTPIWMMVLGLAFPFHICAPQAKNYNIINRNKLKRKSESHGQGAACCQNLCAKSQSSEVDVWHPSAKNCFGRGFGEDRWSFLTPLTFFYTTPMVKFFFHAISSVIFLFLFSFFMLTNFGPRSEQEISTVEYVVWAWALSTFIEEFRQMFESKRHYFSNRWNWMDLIIHALLLLSVILRYSLSSSDFVWARRSYSLALYLCFLRLLELFYAWETIGPKVIMIQRMLKDILRFLLIMLVFILAYGVTAQALRYPNTPASRNMLMDIIYQPYWNIFGELFENDGKILGGGEDGSCTSNMTLHLSAPDKYPRCAHDSELAVVLLVIYMILVNVLLINLLIGMFSSTFADVEKNAKRIWKYHRYRIVTEYYDKPALVPPLIIFSILWRAVLYLYNRGKTQDTPFCTHVDDENGELKDLETNAVNKVLSTPAQPQDTFLSDFRRELLDEFRTMMKQLIDRKND